MANVPLPLTVDHVPWTLGKGNTPANVAVGPQTEKSGPASALVAGGVTRIEYPKSLEPISGQPLSCTWNVKVLLPMFATVGVHVKVPVGCGDPATLKVAPGIPLFQFMVTTWPALTSFELMVKVKGVPAQTCME